MNLDEILKQVDELTTRQAVCMWSVGHSTGFETPFKDSNYSVIMDNFKIIRSLVERVQEADKILDKAEELIYPEYCGTSIWEEFEKKREAYLEKWGNK